MPDYNTALRMAKEAGIDPAEAFEVFAEEERIHKVKNFKLQMGFVQTDLLLFIATGGISCLFYIMSNHDLSCRCSLNQGWIGRARCSLEIVCEAEAAFRRRTLRLAIRKMR